MTINTNRIQINDIMEEIKEVDADEEKSPKGLKTPSNQTNFLDEFKF